jgi:nitroreductase
MEFGHVSQNIYLRAAEHHLAAVLVAGIDDDILGPALARLTDPDLGRLDPLGLIALGAPPYSRTASAGSS